MTVEPELSFGELHFGEVELGDKRRTKRLVRIAETLVRNPSGALPARFNGPGELDAVYHLMKQEEVTHASVLSAHFALTRTALEKTSEYLVVAHDTSSSNTVEIPERPTGNFGLRIFHGSGKTWRPSQSQARRASRLDNIGERLDAIERPCRGSTRRQTTGKMCLKLRTRRTPR